MNPDSVLALSLYVGSGSLLAGLIGAMTGLGGGVVIVPMLTLGFGIDIRYAIGASLVSVIATSSGAAAAYVREGFTNIRVGMFLEIATSLGAILGAHLTAVVNPAAIGVVFGFVLLHSAYTSLSAHGAARETGDTTGRLAGWLRMDGTYPGPDGPRSYHVSSIPSGFALMGVAGVLSGLLGIGSGAVKVLAMDRAMKLPFKVSTTTSNFMIGVTAAASAGVYLHKGYVQPAIAFPVMLGVLAGALLGARLLTGLRTALLRRLFAILITAVALQMLYKGFTGTI